MAFRWPMLRAGVALGRVLVAAQSQFLGALSAGVAPAGRVRALSRHPWVPLCPAPTPRCPARTAPCPAEGPAHPTQPPGCCSRAVALENRCRSRGWEQNGARSKDFQWWSELRARAWPGGGGGHCLVPVASTEPPSPGLGGLLPAAWCQRSPGQAVLRGDAAAAPRGARGELLCLAGRGEHPRRLSRVRLLLHKRWLLSQPEPTCGPSETQTAPGPAHTAPGAALPGPALGAGALPTAQAAGSGGVSLRGATRGAVGDLVLAVPWGLRGCRCPRAP